MPFTSQRVQGQRARRASESLARELQPAQAENEDTPMHDDEVIYSINLSISVSCPEMLSLSQPAANPLDTAGPSTNPEARNASATEGPAQGDAVSSNRPPNHLTPPLLHTAA